MAFLIFLVAGKSRVRLQSKLNRICRRKLQNDLGYGGGVSAKTCVQGASSRRHQSPNGKPSDPLMYRERTKVSYPSCFRKAQHSEHDGSLYSGQPIRETVTMIEYHSLRDPDS